MIEKRRIFRVCDKVLYDVYQLEKHVQILHGDNWKKPAARGMNKEFLEALAKDPGKPMSRLDKPKVSFSALLLVREWLGLDLMKAIFCLYVYLL